MSENLTPKTAEIAASFDSLKQLDLDCRYEIYAELLREEWATDVGYALLPALWTCIAMVRDRVDAEVAYVIGSIQRSFLDDPDPSAYSASMGAYATRECLQTTIDRLRSSEPFCSKNLPLDQCRELIADLSRRCAY